MGIEEGFRLLARLLSEIKGLLREILAEVKKPD